MSGVKPMTTPPITSPAVLSCVSATFPADACAVPRVRALTRALESDQRDDVEIVTSELVTNSVRHAVTATITVELTVTGTGVHVEVTDEDSEHLPQETDAASMDTSGRGLMIVACLCTEVRCVTGPTGKTVCADVGSATETGI